VNQILRVHLITEWLMSGFVLFLQQSILDKIHLRYLLEEYATVYFIRQIILCFLVLHTKVIKDLVISSIDVTQWFISRI